jgi:hypothetical protein
MYRRFTTAFIFLLLTGAIIGIIVPAGTGWDFANFYDTGRRAAAGQIGDLYNPDSLIDGGKPEGSLGFWGPPISAWFYAPLSYLPPATALVVFKIENTLAYFIALLLIYLFYRQFAGDSPAAQSQFAAVFALLSLIYQPFWTVYRVGGQTTPTVFLLFTLALLNYTNTRLMLSSIFLVLALLIKPSFAPVLLFLMFVSGVRFTQFSVLVLLAAGLASVWVSGWDIHVEFLRVALRGAESTFPWFSNSSLYVPLEGIKSATNVGRPSGWLNLVLTGLNVGVKAGVLFTFVLIMVKSRPQPWSPPARRHFHFLMAVCFCLMMSQTVWEHYLSPLFLFLAYVVASRRHFSRSAMTLIGAIFLFGMGQNLIFINLLRAAHDFDSLLELFLVGLFKSAPLLLTLVFLWRHYGELFHSYASEQWVLRERDVYQPIPQSPGALA